MAIEINKNPTSNVGTSLYQASEFEDNQIYNEKVDIFSLGIILFEMLNSFKTMYEKSDKINKLKKYIIYKKANKHLKKLLFKNISKKASFLILKLCSYYPTDRFSINDLLEYIEYFQYYL